MSPTAFSERSSPNSCGEKMFPLCASRGDGSLAPIPRDSVNGGLGIPDEHTVTGSQVKILNHYSISPDRISKIALLLLEV